MSTKVRQKHSESFLELFTEYEKVKRHSVGKNGQKDFLGVFHYFFWFFDANFPKERKWEQADNWRASNKCDRAKVER
jgi:hypothetical protein